MNSLFRILLTLLITTSFFAEDKRPFSQYYDNGNLKIFGFHSVETGKKHGEWAYYYQTGELMRTEQYENGNLIVSSGRTYIDKIFRIISRVDIDEDLNVSDPSDLPREVDFKILILKDDDDFDTSQYSEYYNGFDELDEALSRGVGFVDGKGNKIGHWKWYYPNGGLWRTGEYQNDKAQGKWEIYYQNGKLNKVGNYENDVAVGDWEFYFEDGQVLAYGSYQWGKEDGTWRHYHKNGELSKIYHYESDQYSEKRNLKYWGKYYDDNGELVSIVHSKYGDILTNDQSRHSRRVEVDTGIWHSKQLFKSLGNRFLNDSIR